MGRVRRQGSKNGKDGRLGRGIFGSMYLCMICEYGCESKIHCTEWKTKLCLYGSSNSVNEQWMEKGEVVGGGTT